MRDYEKLWDTIITELYYKEEELQTITGLWFKAYVEDNRLFIDRALEHSPSSNVTKPRSITKNDFQMVHSYYDRWVNGKLEYATRLAGNQEIRLIFFL